MYHYSSLNAPAGGYCAHFSADYNTVTARERGIIPLANGLRSQGDVSLALFGNPSLAVLILRAVTFLIAMTVHEFAHAYAANLMGDTTARDMGRMTLNPFVNINWFGFLMAIA